MKSEKQKPNYKKETNKKTVGQILLKWYKDAFI